MKQLFLYFILLAALSQTAQATKWRVNNRVGINANFTTISAAVNAASSGDTIYIEPSPTNYTGAINIDKKLTIIGNGYFNSSPNTMNSGLQADSNSCSIYAYIYFNQGSAGTTIMGVSLYGGYAMYVYSDSITIQRNFIYGYIYLSNYNTTSGTYGNRISSNIKQNIFYVYGISNQSFSTTGGLTMSNINIQNNIFNSCSVNLPSGMSGFMQNNMFHSANTSTYNFQVNNNIMHGGSFDINNNVYFNNIGTSTQFGTLNNNQQNITTTALFNNFSATTETRYTLKNPGPGIGAGFNSVDVGVFGGPDPYKLSGIPPVPTIYSISAPVTTTTSTLPVTISTKSND